MSLSCRPDGMVDLGFDGLPAGAGEMFVDRIPVASGNWTMVDGSASFYIDPTTSSDILTAMQRGNRIDIDIGGRSAAFGLRGSSNAISKLLATCRSKGAVQKVVAGNGVYKRFPNEATMEFPATGEPFEIFSRTKNFDYWGNDIRSGLEDPLLKGMTERQCAALCQLTENCGAYTWNGRDGDVCFLKTGQGRMVEYRGAVSGELTGTPRRLPPPPTRGPQPVIDESVAWRDGDTEESHAARVRVAAARLGRSCEAERADLEALSKSIDFSIPLSPARVAEPFVLEWRGNDLIERIPVWVMASTPAPVRFDGNGFFALGPEAPNPFGIAPGKGETRALVALWARGAGTSGQIQVQPLQAGETPVTMRLVAYLRACQEEVVLEEKTHTLDVAPAPAELVVGTPASRADLALAFDIPKFNRRVELNETRLRISVLSDGTEIAERAGSDVSLSPTQRFVTIRHNSATEIVDLVDGLSVVSLAAASGWWTLGDTYFVGSTAPWQRVWVVSTFQSDDILKSSVNPDVGTLTGPACCQASPANTLLSFDLENASLHVEGELGSAYLSLQNSDWVVRDEPVDGYLAPRLSSTSRRLVSDETIGPVSPLALKSSFTAPGGFSEAYVDEGVWGGDTESAGLLPDRVQTANSNVQVMVIQQEDRSSVMPEIKQVAENQLSRVGLQLSMGDGGSDLISPIEHMAERPDRYSEKGIQRWVSGNQLAYDAVANAASNSGVDFSWITDTSENFSRDCYHLNPEEMVGEAAALLPVDLNQLRRHETATGSVFVARASCTAGATAGSLRNYSLYSVMDFRGDQPDTTTKDIVAASYWRFAGNYRQQFYDPPFLTRLDRDVLLHWAKGRGIASVWDLREDEFLWVREDLPSGGLLEDLRLTADGRHVVQINSDGGFHVHQIEDGETVLHGRIVEEEVTIWTDDFLFDATAEAASLIDLRFPGLDGQFSLDRFEPLLYVPELAAKVLSGQTLPRVGKLDVPPDISGTLSLDQGEIVADFDLDPSRGATELRVYQDGVLTHTLPLATSQADGEFRVPRLSGTRHASIVAASAEGLVSLPVTADLGPAAPGGTRRALAVAVDLYADPGLPDLNFAKSDADRLIGAIMELPETVPAFEEPRFVGGRRAGPDEVLSAIDELIDGLGASDHAVLFFAGHGIQGDDGEFYMAIHDTDLHDLAGTALTWASVAERLSGTNARITILIDACHSGAASGDVLATNDGAVAGLSAVPSNVTILAASKGRQLSREVSGSDKQSGGGLFSLALRRVLVDARETFDTNRNGRIEASELSRGVSTTVTEQTKGKQTPWMTKGRIVGDYSIF